MGRRQQSSDLGSMVNTGTGEAGDEQQHGDAGNRELGGSDEDAGACGGGAALNWACEALGAESSGLGAR